MKNIALLVTLCALSFAAVAQQPVDGSRLPVKGDKAASFNLLGIYDLVLNFPRDTFTNDPLLDIRYFHRDKFAFRFAVGFGARTRETTTLSDSSGGNPLISTVHHRNNHSYTFGIGVEKHITTNSKTVDPYIAPMVYLGFLGGRHDIYDSTATEAGGDYTISKSEIQNPGGLLLRLQVNVGFFWYVSRSMALGGEFGIGYASTGISGDVESSATVTSSSGGSVTTSSSSAATPFKDSSSIFATLNTGAVFLLIKF